MTIGQLRRDWLTAFTCLAMLLGSAILAAVAVHGKSATYDEPVHLVQGWVDLHTHDFRMETGHPALWEYWATLPLPSNALHPDLGGAQWANMPQGMEKPFPFSTQTLYKAGTDADALLFRARLIMLLPAFALGLVLAAWSWTLAGPRAALAATALFALDPNFLAHAPLVKNDVPSALIFLSAMFTTWLLGKRITTARAVAVGLIVGVGICVKFSCFLLAPIIAVTLLLRATSPVPWPAWSMLLRRPLAKIGVVAGLCIAWSLMGGAIIWASYGFRFAMSPDPALHANIARYAEYARYNACLSRHPNSPPTRHELEVEPNPVLVRLATSAMRAHFLPEAWLNAVVAMVSTSSNRRSFLMGHYSLVGWWYYFPLAMLFKTPLATMAALVVALAAIFTRAGSLAFRGRDHFWTALCIAMPVVAYLGGSMAGHLNLGFRHVLPIYPFLFLAAGVAFVVLGQRFKTPVAVFASVIAVSLALESLFAFPDYIPFFNLAVGGQRGGAALLSDSNIDWGQDLPLLAQWQRENPQTPLYLCYFGTADPAAYGIRYLNMPGSLAPDTPGSAEARRSRTLPAGVIAISVTQLQGTYLTPEMRRMYSQFRERPPLAVLGGSIYLYEF